MGLTTISAAYDNIRLIRRKIRIAQDQMTPLPQGAQRDAAIKQLSDLTRDLIHAMQDFADAGFEDDVAQMLAAPSHGTGQAPTGQGAGDNRRTTNRTRDKD